MGTFRIPLMDFIVTASPGVPESVTGWYNQSSFGSSEAELALALSPDTDGGLLKGQNWTFPTPAPANLNITIAYQGTLSGAIISLDGDAPVSFNSLPAGFNMDSAQLNIDGGLLEATPIILQAQLNDVADTGDYTLTITVPGATFPFSGNFTFGSDTASYGVQALPVADGTTMLELLTQGFEININMNGSNIFGQLAVLFGAGYFTGTYSLQQSQFELEPTPQPIDPDIPNPITVISPVDELLEGVEQVIIDYIDANGDPQQVIVLPEDFITQEPDILIFLMPPIPGAHYFQVTIVGDGIIFSGSVPLGFLPTILFLGGSGIYELSLAQAFDTCYINEDPGETLNVNIPDPFGRTGFIGG